MRALCLLAIFTVPAQARNLAIIKFGADIHLYAATAAGPAHLVLPHRFVSSVRQGVGLAYLSTPEGLWLYGVGATGIVSYKLPVSQVSSVTLGEGIGVINSSGRVFVFGLGDEQFYFTEVRGPIASTQVQGRLALLMARGSHYLFGQGRRELHSVVLNGLPSSIRVGTDMVVTTSGNGTHLYTLGSAGFVSDRISNLRPQDIELF